ncbi:MAG: FtsQ-type POTRA domain-containing protein, partial [Sneathiella sp.]|nr:FtsQ-type POTRA domain-containing protein [Sneathiella sp.]
LIQKAMIWVDDTKEEALASLGMTIQEVSVTGRDRTTPHSLMKVLQVERGRSIFDFDPEVVRSRIEQLGWVETASVMRRFPDEIFVRLTERRPFARWQLNGKTSIIDRNGVVITKSEMAEFRYLPKIVGIAANKDAAELFDMLAKTPALFTRLQNAIRIRERRWNLEFDNGVTVLLPEEGSSEAWAGLDKMQQDKKILNKSVMTIDLRSKDRIYVRLRPDDAQIRRDAESET